MTFPYAPLLQPLQIGKLTIKNRFCVGPLTLPSLHGPFGEFSENGLAYFEERAKGGFGLIFTGAFHPDTLVDPVHPLDSKQPLKAPKSFQRSAVELLERLDAYGAKMMPQVSMGYGRNALGCFCPSEIPYYHDPARIAPALTKDQIKQKIDQMIATAVLLKQCGFPGIEVHAMHWGYLLDQFAMTFMNHRTDEYGGALENRLRCAREILDGVKAACGSDFVVSMRLALKSYIKGYNHPSLHGEDEVGRTLEEGLEIAKRLEAYGYDCLSVDFGQYDSFYYAAPPCYMEKGRVLPLAKAAKEAVKIPILCGGRMNDPDLAAQAVAEARHWFRPELIGRLDELIVFRPLGEESMSCIAEKLLSQLEARAARSGYQLTHTPRVGPALAAKARSPYGARELRRQVDRAVEQALADQIASGAAHPGQHWTADCTEDGNVILEETSCISSCF